MQMIKKISFSSMGVCMVMGGLLIRKLEFPQKTTTLMHEKTTDHLPKSRQLSLQLSLPVLMEAGQLQDVSYKMTLSAELQD